MVAHSINTIENESENNDLKQLFIKSDKRFIQLNISEVYFLESYGNYVKVWVENKVYLTPRTLSSFEIELANEDNKFIRIHKSYIVQKAHIKMIENRKVEMSNQQSLPLGKNHKLLARVIDLKSSLGLFLHIRWKPVNDLHQNQ